MAQSYWIIAKRGLLACFFVSTSAWADSGFLDRVGSLFDNIGEGLSFVGKKAGKLVGPGLGLGEKSGTDFTHVRQFNERYPVQPAPVVSVSSEFGEVRVTTWSNQVVQVVAEIVVGAGSLDAAEEIANTIEIQVTPGEDRLEIRTRLPDTRDKTGKVAITVNYRLTIPDDASLIAENYFGDTVVRDVGGTVAVKAQYGLVDLRNVSGPVHAQTRGEFAVEARGLRAGGVFDLSGAHALFSDISGSLTISNSDGPIEVQDLGAEAELAVANAGGAIILHLPERASPDLVATCLFGSIQSEFELDQTSQQQRTVARSPNMESKQRISLRTSFGDIYIKLDGAAAEPQPIPGEETAPFKDVTQYAKTLAQGTELFIDAISGDVRIEGVDEDELRVTATKFVRVRNENNAQAAIEALRVAVEEEEGRLVVRTNALDEAGVLGYAAYRIDLAVECPRTCPIVVEADDGNTSIAGTGESIHVEQGAGAITVEHAKGPAELVNRNGGIRAVTCAGPIQVAARRGTIELSEIFGDVTAVCEEGKTVMESLEAGAVVKNRGGDVRIIALEGVKGDYDIGVENGNLSILLPTSADATFEVVAENGTIYSGIPLNGAIDRGIWEFHGRLADGTHRVALRVKDGDIRIN